MQFSYLSDLQDPVWGKWTKGNSLVAKNSLPRTGTWITVVVLHGQVHDLHGLEQYLKAPPNRKIISSTASITDI